MCSITVDLMILVVHKDCAFCSRNLFPVHACVVVFISRWLGIKFDCKLLKPGTSKQLASKRKL